MASFVLRRFLVAIPILLGVTLITFVFINLVPGDYIDTLINPDLSGANRANLEPLEHQLGLDKPAPVRYVLWLKQVATGNLGYSLADSKTGHRRDQAVTCADFEADRFGAGFRGGGRDVAGGRQRVASSFTAGLLLDPARVCLDLRAELFRGDRGALSLFDPTFHLSRGGHGTRRTIRRFAAESALLPVAAGGDSRTGTRSPRSCATPAPACWR